MSRRLIKNYLYNTILTLSSILFPIITFPYVSRVLNPYYLGEVNFAQSIVFYFYTISKFGISTFGLRKIAQNKGVISEIKKEFSRLVFINIISSIFSFLLILISLLFFPKLVEMKTLILIFGINVLTDFMNIEWFFNGIENYKLIAHRTLIARSFQIITIFLFIKNEQDYIWYVVILVGTDMLNKTINIYYAKDFFDFKFFTFKGISYDGYLKSNLIIFLSSLAINLYLTIDATMLGFLKGSSEVGLYTSATKMTKIVIPLITSLGLVLSPGINYYVKEKNKKKIFSTMNTYLDFIFFLSMPTIIYLMIFAKNIIELFSGSAYSSSSLTMQIMIPIIIFISLNNFAGGQVFVPTGNEKKILYVSLVGVFINIIFNFTLIPKYGKNGAAVATLMSELAVCSVRLILVKKIYEDYIIFTKDRIMCILVSCSYIYIYIYITDIKLEPNLNLIFNFFVFSIYYLLVMKVFKNKMIENIINLVLKK